MAHPFSKLFARELLLCWHTPPAAEKVVDGDEQESGVCAVEKALNQPQAEAPKGQPLESR